MDSSDMGGLTHMARLDMGAGSIDGCAYVRSMRHSPRLAARAEVLQNITDHDK